MSYGRHGLGTHRVVPTSRILRVRDAEHAESLLRDLVPHIDDEERVRVARDLADGFAILVDEHDFERVDPHEPGYIAPLDPVAPIAPVSPPPPIDPAEEEPWISFEVVDEDGRPLPVFHAHLLDPSGAQRSVQLDAGGRAEVNPLAADGTCSLTLEVKPKKLP